MDRANFLPAREHVLEWIMLLSVLTSALCFLALLVVMVVGRWRNAVRRKENRRRSLLHDDMLD